MNILQMNTVKKTISLSTDQLVLLRMVNATHQEQTMDAEKLKLGNGPTLMIN